MTKEQKSQYIESLSEELKNSGVFYLADTAGLDSETTTKLRRTCFKNGITLKVIKNTLLEKAMEQIEDKDFGDLPTVLAGPTAIMFAEVGNAPAKVIKEFRKKNDKPVLKGAYVEESVYIGDDQVETLVNIKSKDELLGEIIGLLQSPAKNVVSGLKSGGGTLAGILKPLSEREG